MSSKLALLLKQKRSADCIAPQQPGEKQQHAPKRPRQQYQQPSGDPPAARQLRQQQHGNRGSNGSQRQPAAVAGAAAGVSRPHAAAIDANDSGDDAEPLGPAAGAQAYSTLVNLLSQRHSQLGAVLKQQQAQQEGLSDASESENESDAGSGESGSEQPSLPSDDDAEVRAAAVGQYVETHIIISYTSPAGSLCKATNPPRCQSSISARHIWADHAAPQSPGRMWLRHEMHGTHSCTQLPTQTHSCWQACVLVACLGSEGL